MSYSRWSESELYTYWADTYSRSRDDQTFVCHVSVTEEHSVSYKDLRTLGVLDCAYRMLETSHPGDGDLQDELCGYLKEFMIDVETYFVDIDLGDGTKPMSIWALISISVLGIAIIAWAIFWSEAKRLASYLWSKVKSHA